jgi:hypothetical protein
LDNIREICGVLGIREREVNWNRLCNMNDDDWDVLWSGVLNEWYHPYNEWSVMNVRSMDDRSREWKDFIIMRLMLSSAW